MAIADPSIFDDIRPYNDDEVQPTLARLLGDNEFLDTVAQLKMPKMGKMALSMMRPMVRKAVAQELDGVDSVSAFQQKLEVYVRRMLDETVTELTVSGLEYLEPSRAYCFISNHRDIAVDSMLVNWLLYQNGFQTLRIAIGDNLLSKPFASDLMRLNKSFIVNRSATSPREKLRAAQKLSAYIQHSITDDGANIWIAQREGRAKDGLDKSNPAIISMLALSRVKTEPFAEFLRRINIVPVSISYEWDPCDVDKARELTLKQAEGGYQKGEHEDVQSIARGITGQKGRVHLTFGQPLVTGLDTVEQVVSVLDRAILQNYVLHPSNCIAYQILEGTAPQVPVTDAGIAFSEYDCSEAREAFDARLQACDPQWRDLLLRIYANPVYAKLAVFQASC